MVIVVSAVCFHLVRNVVVIVVSAVCFHLVSNVVVLSLIHI